jgi:hypothetical protein
MCGHWLIAAMLSSTLHTTAADEPAGPVQIKDLTDNVQVRLIGIRGGFRSGVLVANFEMLDEGRDVFNLSFPPASHTTQERTIYNVFIGCCGLQTAKVPASGWYPVKDGVEAVFSIPKRDGGMSRVDNKFLARCYLVSLKIGGEK